jgi:hypothetical protein
MAKKKIKSFEHACEVLGQQIDIKKFNQLGLPVKDLQPLIDYYKITKITEATNKLNKWKAKWGNSSQWKYSPYFRVKADDAKPSGFGFSDPGYGCWHTSTTVGSRLCVGTSEEARYIGETFIALFESAWLIIEAKD